MSELPGGPVLVVDDDAPHRTLLRDLLQRIGLDVVEAEDGATALRSAARQPPSLVLLDVQLPLVGGYEVCHELRERYGQDLPIVFVSGTRIESDDRTAGIMLGADDYITKPFDPDELLARVRRLLRRSSSAVDAPPANGVRGADRERARGARAHGRGRRAGRDRETARDQPADRRHAHPAHPREARRPQPRPGRGPRPHAGSPAPVAQFRAVGGNSGLEGTESPHMRGFGLFLIAMVGAAALAGVAAPSAGRSRACPPA